MDDMDDHHSMATKKEPEMGVPHFQTRSVYPENYK